MVDLFTTGMIDLLNKAVSDALQASMDESGNVDKGKFGVSLVTALAQNIATMFKIRLQGMFRFLDRRS